MCFCTFEIALFFKFQSTKQTAAADGNGGKTLFEIGTTVEVRGMTQFFREQLEIKAFSVKTVENPNDEVDRMLIVNQFRRTQAFQSLFLNSSEST